MLMEVRQLGKGVAELAAAPLYSLSDDQIVALMRDVRYLEQTAGLLQALLAQEVSGRALPRAHGHRGLAGWLRATLLLDPLPARQLVEHAAAMQRPTLQQAVLDGRMDLRQAAAIADTCDAIPQDLEGNDEVSLAETADLVARAETVQTEMADRLPAWQLRRVGERILEHVAPHLAEYADERAMRRQRARRGLSLSVPYDGLVHISGNLTATDAAIVNAALDPLCSPVAGDERTPAQRRADALVDICRLALRTGDLPANGGQPPQVTVVVHYDPLTQAFGSATTENGQPVPAATLRQLACDARILPVMLDGAGQILDAGRTRRTASAALRRALAVRDGGCAFPTCDRPPRWADVHHIVPWHAGGRTDLVNTVLLCPHHHTVAHDKNAGWTIRPGADGRPDFIPPPHIDPEQKPLRNTVRRAA